MEENNEKTVYTYYEPLGMGRNYAEEDLIKICAKSWEKNGWKLVVLNYELAKSHDFYSSYSEVIRQLPSVNTPFYDYHCYMRWLAMSKIGGGIMIDYDVVNLSLIDDSIFQQKMITGFQGHVPCVVSGTAEQYLETCKIFCELRDNEKCIDNNYKKPHTSDMMMIARGFKEDQFNKINYIVDYPKTAPLVHCPQDVCFKNNKNKLQAMSEII
jgi:hypothetical protein